MALAESRMPFEPKGEQAEWRMIYDELLKLEIGDVITYSELDEILDRDFLGDRAPFYRATREVERTLSRTFAPVRGKGYRMVEPDEHVDLVVDRLARSRRQVRRGREVADSTDLARIKDPEARNRIRELRLLTRRHETMLRQQNLRLDRHEQMLKEARQSHVELEQKIEKVDKVIDTLKRHGIDVE